MDILAKAVGRRKEAVAQVQIKLGTGQFIINNKPAQEYLQNDFYSLLSVKAPFNVLSISKQSDNFKKTSSSYVEVEALLSNSSFSTQLPNLLSTEVKNQEGEQPIVPSSTSSSSYVEVEKEDDTFVKLDTIVIVKGGGLKGQTEAIRLGISRALCLLPSNTSSSLENATFLVNEIPLNLSNALDIRKQLKDQGYLTQDSRVKERRKYGLKKARKASQYHKR